MLGREVLRRMARCVGRVLPDPVTPGGEVPLEPEAPAVRAGRRETLTWVAVTGRGPTAVGPEETALTTGADAGDRDLHHVQWCSTRAGRNARHVQPGS